MHEAGSYVFFSGLNLQKSGVSDLGLFMSHISLRFNRNDLVTRYEKQIFSSNSHFSRIISFRNDSSSTTSKKKACNPIEHRNPAVLCRVLQTFNYIINFLGSRYAANHTVTN